MREWVERDGKRENVRETGGKMVTRERGERALMGRERDGDGTGKLIDRI